MFGVADDGARAGRIQPDDELPKTTDERDGQVVGFALHEIGGGGYFVPDSAAASVCPTRHGRPRVSVMTTPTAASKRSLSA